MKVKTEMPNPNVEHRMLRVLWTGDTARYQCSCGEDGPRVRGAYGAPHDHRPFKSADAEARELHACHVEIEKKRARLAAGGGA